MLNTSGTIHDHYSVNYRSSYPN